MISCAKLAANVVSNVVETGKQRQNLRKISPTTRKSAKVDAERLAPKDAVRIERESNKERIGLSTAIRKIARSRNLNKSVIVRRSKKSTIANSACWRKSKKKKKRERRNKKRKRRRSN